MFGTVGAWGGRAWFIGVRVRGASSAARGAVSPRDPGLAYLDTPRYGRPREAAPWSPPRVRARIGYRPLAPLVKHTWPAPPHLRCRDSSAGGLVGSGPAQPGVVTLIHR